MSRPDFLATEFEPARTADILHQQGALLLRQALTISDNWLECFQGAYTKMDELYYTGQLSARAYEVFYRYGHVHHHLIRDYQDWLGYVLNTPLIRACLRAYFGPQAWLLASNSIPRRQGPEHPEHAIPFHQDREFLGDFERALNLWIPLTAAGGNYPGLELWLGGPQQPIFELEHQPEERQRIARSIPETELWQPQMQAGDLLCFTPYTIHRTSLNSEQKEIRFSSEIRLISAADRARTRSSVIVCDL